MRDTPRVRSGAEPTSFVGRAAELAALDELFRTLPERGAATALIAGEAGMGKSRLAGELQRRAEHGGAVVAVGRTPAAGASLPYGVIVALVRDLARRIDGPRGHRPARARPAAPARLRRRCPRARTVRPPPPVRARARDAQRPRLGPPAGPDPRRPPLGRHREHRAARPPRAQHRRPTPPPRGHLPAGRAAGHLQGGQDPDRVAQPLLGHHPRAGRPLPQRGERAAQLHHRRRTAVDGRRCHPPTQRGQPVLRRGAGRGAERAHPATGAA